MEEFGKRSFFVKPKWFHGGFFFVAETSCDVEWFQVTLEVFFFFNVSISKNDPILAKIHHMLGFNETILKPTKTAKWF